MRNRSPTFSDAQGIDYIITIPSSLEGKGLPDPSDKSLKPIPGLSCHVPQKTDEKIPTTTNSKLNININIKI